MSAPDNYDTATVKIDPQSLWSLAKQVETSRQALVTHVDTIFGALKALSNGWNSDSEQEARAFAQQLGAACDDVFGSDGSDLSTNSGPVPGVLAQYLNFLQAAADGFDDTEAQLVKQWQKYNADMAGSGDGGGSQGSGAVTDPTQTAVSYDVVGR